MICPGCDNDTGTLWITDKPIHREPEPFEGTAVCIDCQKATLTRLIEQQERAIENSDRERAVEDHKYRLRLLRRWLKKLEES